MQAKKKLRRLDIEFILLTVAGIAATVFIYLWEVSPIGRGN